MRDDNFLEHFGVKGMKWGRRKTYTPKDRDIKSYTTDDKKVVLKKGSELYLDSTWG